MLSIELFITYSLLSPYIIQYTTIINNTSSHSIHTVIIMCKNIIKITEMLLKY
jgi:hypothetical protein